MTMIIAAHLEDSLLIAADRRAMHFDLETTAMRFAHDRQQKIQHWSGGAITGTGETVFLNRIMQQFQYHNAYKDPFKPLHIIQTQLKKRISEGVPAHALANNTLLYTHVVDQAWALFSIPVHPLVQHLEDDLCAQADRFVHRIQAKNIELLCFNLPSDFSRLQHFQLNIKALADFHSKQAGIAYYIEQLKPIFAEHAATDPSISTAFDLYVQSCRTGTITTLHVPNTE